MSSELSHVRFEPLFKRGGGGCGDVILVSSRLFDANLIGESQLELKWIEFGTVNHSRSHLGTFTVTAAVSLIFSRALLWSAFSTFQAQNLQLFYL